MDKNDIFDDLKIFLLGNSLKKLGETIQRGISEAAKQREAGFNAALFPTLYILNKYQESSVLKISDLLSITHPAVIQILNKLKKNNLVETKRGHKDKRQTLVTLTESGKELYNNWQSMFNDIELVNKQIIDESGYDILKIIDTTNHLLHKKDYNQRISDINKKKLMQQVEILTYNKKYRDDFKKLNIEWLKEYFTVEPEDEKLLHNPEKEIIKKGGEIFFASLNNEIIGTCAAIKIDKYTYELSKMAVTKKAQGKQAGKKLALSVIGFAFSKKAKYVTLLTNKKLYEATNLYKQLGFEIDNTPLRTNYNRELFRMTLLLQ